MEFKGQVYHREGHCIVGSFEGYIESFDASSFENARNSEKIKNVIDNMPHKAVEILINSYPNNEKDNKSIFYDL